MSRMKSSHPAIPVAVANEALNWSTSPSSRPRTRAGESRPGLPTSSQAVLNCPGGDLRAGAEAEHGSDVFDVVLGGAR